MFVAFRSGDSAGKVVEIDCPFAQADHCVIHGNIDKLACAGGIRMAQCRHKAKGHDHA